MKIGYATADWSLAYTQEGIPTYGGAGWYRVGLPSTGIAKHTDHETVTGILIGQGDTLGVREWVAGKTDEGTAHFDCDIVVIQRYMNDDLPDAIRRARASGQAIVNDVDDWFWGLSPSNRAFQHSHPKNDPANNVNHYAKSLGASTLITTSTPYLAKRLEGMVGNTPVLVVRNAIDVGRFARSREARLHASPTVGWVGAQPWRSGDLETLRGVLGPWLARSGWGFHHSGDVADSAMSAAALAGIPEGVPVTTEPMAPIYEYPALFDNIDVGLVPLRSCPFNEAKSGIKGMEYAASGVPFIAAATDEYDWLTGQVKVGRLARKPKDWLKALDVLADPSVRRAEAARNLEAVERLSIDTQYINWVDAYREAFSLEG